jgi:hypothetical protein
LAAPNAVLTRMHIATVTFAQLAAAALVNDIEVYSLPARAVITGIMVKPSIAFGGGALTDYAVSVGLVGNLEFYMPLYSVIAVGDQVFSQVTIDDMQNYGAATSIRLAAYATGASLNAATAGSLDVWGVLSRWPVPA